ncbi:MAG: hypothetical protein JO053_15820, partial [Acidobacteria bacterium]|nr:hypothetical protein [Acidobacteriota bacterium]
RNFGNVTFNVIQNAPYYSVLGDPNVPVNSNNFGNFGIAGPNVTLPKITLRAVDPNIVTAHASQWGVSVEHELAPNTVAKFEYSASKGRNLYSIWRMNRAGSGIAYLGSNAISGVDCPATLPSTNRLNCNYSYINYRASDGVSDYYGFTTSLESLDLFHKGLALTARYTYSNAKDDLSSTFSSGGNGNFQLGYLDPFRQMLDYGPAEYDVRHRFIASAIYQVPFKFDNHVANMVFGDWNVSAIVNIQSGAPFTIYDCTNGIVLCMRMEAQGTVKFNKTSVLSGPNTYDWIDLTGVPNSTFLDASGVSSDNGNPFPSDMTSRNAFRGPGFWNVDMSFFKNIHITERYRVQLRADAFNVFNHANTFVNAGTADVTNGVVNAFKAGNRRIQLLARFSF